MTTHVIPTPERQSGPSVSGARRPAPLRSVPHGVRPLRTLLHATDEIVRRGLVDLLRHEPSVRIANYDGPLNHAIETGSVDLVVFDLAAPELSAALEDIRKIKEFYPDIKVVALAGELTDEEVLVAVYAGVDGIAWRSAPSDDLLAVFRLAARGEPALDRRFTAGMVRGLRSQGRTGGSSLTAREREVLNHVARGQRNPTIARTLFISESTVKFHLRNITEKLGASNRAELVAIALRLGLAD